MRIIHHKINIVILLITICFFSIQAQNNQNISDRIIRQALEDERGYNLLNDLCQIGSRLSGSPSSLRAINWTKDTMVKSQFDSVWLQPVWVPHWERGNTESAIIVSPNDHKGRELSIASLGGSIGTPSDGVTGLVIEVDSLTQIEQQNIDASGKIVFFNQAYDRGLVNTFRAYGKAVKQRTRGAIEAARAGAVAAIVRSVTSQHDNVPHVGVMYYNDTIPKIPAVAIGVEDADFLSNALRKQKDVKVNLQLSCTNHDSALSYNIIGEIKGSQYPDEIIVVGGHFDAWDKGHGAHDDGAGCIQALEVLDLMRRLDLKPKRTIRCVLFNDEEQRQTGAHAYAARVDSLGEKHLAAIEADRGAFMPRGFYVDADSLTIARMQRWLPLLKKTGIEWIRKGGSGADISKIKNAKALIGFVPDIQRYFDYHHSANDTFDKVHPREMEFGSAAMTILTWLLSEEGL